MKRRTFMVGAFAATMVSRPTLAQTSSPKRPVKIGILNDLSGVYADYQGVGSAVASRLAVADFAASIEFPVEVIAADHQNKADIGASIARQWFDRDGVDVVMDVPNSSVALAVSALAREKNKILIGSGAGTSLLTGAQCSPNTVHWTYDTWSLGHSLGKAIVEEGSKKWFFITADYAFGHDLEANAAAAVKAGGGTVVGAVRHPLGTSDFSSFLLQAQASGADVVGFANAGGDTTTSLKQAAEFGLGKKQKLAGLIVDIQNIRALGISASQGIQLVSSFYWDRNDNTRAFAARFQKAHPRQNMPNDMQAGCYSATLHYLKAVKRIGSADDGRAVVEAMKALPTDDPLFGAGEVRGDGRKLHPMFLFEVKASAESKGDWDFLKQIRTIPPAEAWRPLSEGGCPLIKT